MTDTFDSLSAFDTTTLLNLLLEAMELTGEKNIA
jgi:hypothetical protein